MQWVFRGLRGARIRHPHPPGARAAATHLRQDASPAALPKKKQKRNLFTFIFLTARPRFFSLRDAPDLPSKASELQTRVLPAAAALCTAPCLSFSTANLMRVGGKGHRGGLLLKKSNLDKNQHGAVAGFACRRALDVCWRRRAFPKYPRGFTAGAAPRATAPVSRETRLDPSAPLNEP